MKAIIAAFEAEYAGGFRNSVPAYNAGRGATSAYIVEMLMMLPLPRSFMPAPILCTVRAGQHTPAVRFRIHTSMVPCSREPAGVLNPEDGASSCALLISTSMA